METDNIKMNIKDEILGKIQSGEIKMTPRSYFLTKLCLMAFLILLIFITSTFLLSYILFSVRAGGYVFLLQFGVKGVYHFILALPWLLLILNTVLMLLLDWLLKSFKFGYKSPILYLFIGSFALITVFGLLINVTPFHGSMLRRAEENRPPIAPGFGGLYDGIRKSHQETGIFRGTVRSISTSTFTILYETNDAEGGYFRTVYVPKGTVLEGILKLGDTVLVAGSLSGENIMAYGVHKLAQND